MFKSVQFAAGMAFIACFSFVASAAEPYDEKLEFVESTGTQWVDTGVKLNWRRSTMQLDFRILEVPASVGGSVTIAGVTGVANAPAPSSSPGRRSFVMSIAQPNAGKYQLWPYFTGSVSSGYFWPNTPIANTNQAWEVRSEWRDRLYGGVLAPRCFAIFSGHRQPGASAISEQKTGGYYNNYPDAESDYSFYIGVANNAGEGLFDAEGTLAKLH